MYLLPRRSSTKNSCWVHLYIFIRLASGCISYQGEAAQKTVVGFTFIYSSGWPADVSLTKEKQHKKQLLGSPLYIHQVGQRMYLLPRKRIITINIIILIVSEQTSRQENKL